MKTSGKLNKLMLAMTLAVIPSASLPCLALESGMAAISAAKGDFLLEINPNERGSDRKEVQDFLDSIQKQWNGHNLEALMENYADDYVNNDGLNKKAVTDLTKDFWEQYPDAKSDSKTKEIRIDGNFATVDSRDVASGNTAKDIPGINGRGELRSVSEGQLYLRKFANGWRIIGDRVDYEKVKVAYGLAKEIDATFLAPEQVKAGKKYAAKLEVKLPSGLVAVGEITSQNLRFPSGQNVFPNSPSAEVWKPLDTNALEKDDYILERIMEANTSNHNELLMTTVGVTNAARNSLVGLEFLTRRLNVVPATTDEPVEVAEGSKDTKDAKGTKEAKDTKAAKESKEEKKQVEEVKKDTIPDVDKSNEATSKKAPVKLPKGLPPKTNPTQPKHKTHHKSTQ